MQPNNRSSVAMFDEHSPKNMQSIRIFLIFNFQFSIFYFLFPISSLNFSRRSELRAAWKNGFQNAEEPELWPSSRWQFIINHFRETIITKKNHSCFILKAISMWLCAQKRFGTFVWSHSNNHWNYIIPMILINPMLLWWQVAPSLSKDLTVSSLPAWFTWNMNDFSKMILCWKF